MSKEAPGFGISEEASLDAYLLLKSNFEMGAMKSLIDKIFDIMKREHPALFEFIEEETKGKTNTVAYQVGAIWTYTAISYQLTLDGRLNGGKVVLTSEELSDYKQDFVAPPDGTGLAVAEFLKETSREFLSDVVSFGMKFSAKSRKDEEDFFQGVCDVGIPFFRKTGVF